LTINGEPEMFKHAVATKVSGMIGEPERTETPQVKSHSLDVRRVTWIGLATNIVLSIFKMVGGVWGSSQAVIADAVHSLSDCGTDIVILIGVRYWSKPPDEDHPYGHQRIETVVSITIGLVLAGVAFGLIYYAIESFMNPRSTAPNLLALFPALLSMLVKELLYRWTKLWGKRIKSSALIANAWHHRSDALSSIPASIAVIACLIDPALVFVDGVGALLVSLFILHAAWRIVAPGIAELTDKGATYEDTEGIARIALKEEHVREAHKVRTRFSGFGLQVDLHVLVDGSLTVCKGHDIAEAVKKRLLAENQYIVDVVVHIEPYEEKFIKRNSPPPNKRS
jgi:cation diffusion facilitator family transporter